jgi:hypothetical protein
MSSYIDIIPATKSDIDAMVQLSLQKRLDYEKHRHVFWKYGGEKGDLEQAAWFKELLERDDYILLKATEGPILKGFIIGQLVQAPSVYNPGGLTLTIDDFCVAESSLWQTVGKNLLHEIRERAFTKGAVQVIIACGAHDQLKRNLLKGMNYSVTTEWFVG